MERYRKYLESKSNVQVNVQGQAASLPVATPLGFQALEDLISQEILMQIAEEEGVLPTSEDIQKEIEFRTKLNPAFIQQQTAMGINLQQIKDALKVQLAQEKILTKGITVAADEASQYIKDNPKQFEEPATVDALWVVVNSDALKAKVDQALASGEGFQKVAMTYSVDPNIKTTGGKFPQTRLDAMVEPVRKAIEATSTGKQTPWIKFQDGQAKLLVEKKTAATPQKITDAHKQYVQRQLAMQRGRVANDLDKRLQERLRSTKIEVSYDALKPLWKQAEDTIKKTGQTQSTTGTGGATTGAIPAGTTGPATTGN